MYLREQELCQKLKDSIKAEYNIENINSISKYIYKSKYYRNNILNNILENNPFWSRLIRLLEMGWPIQYILEEAVFMDLSLYVNQSVLIPRPETEELVFLIEKEYKLTHSPLKVLDIGTGSGAIPIYLKRKFPYWLIEAIDISSGALAVAQENASRYNLEINFLNLDFLKLKNQLGMYDLIISNPPYISHGDRNSISKQVLDFEPTIALFAESEDSEIFYRAIAEFASQSLSVSGKIFCEMNEFRTNEVRQIFESFGFLDITIHQDLQNKPRIIEVGKSK
ncbi:MAG: peptide chain release factor N(5)-glutamine methyltransferase [Saprospiraceae bacterium]|nr:peptide chain release factor N(5)-glutamine methyltransferase [Saprospiraceae bacterium]